MTRRISVLCCVLAVLLLTAGSAAAQIIAIRAGDDSWVTPAGGSTFYDFSVTPIPAGFFGPGSQPFSAVVTFKGQPLMTAPPGALGSADTLIRRLNNLAIPVGGSGTVPIRIIALDLVSESPITVTFVQGGLTFTQLWNVKLTLSLLARQPNGAMTINVNCLTGGTFSSNLPVLPRFQFTRGSQVRSFDCGSGACAPQQLTSLNGCWALLPPQGPFNPAACNADPLPPGVGVDGDCDGIFEVNTLGRLDFIPGFDGCSGVACRRCQLVEQHPVGAVHTVVPSQSCEQGQVLVTSQNGAIAACQPVPTDTGDTGTTGDTGGTTPNSQP